MKLIWMLMCLMVVGSANAQKVLKAGAELLKINDTNVGFIMSDDRDYDNYRSFYRNTAVKAK